MKTRLQFSLLISFVVSSIAFPQAPNSFRYQSMLRKANGSALAGQAVKIKISILKGGVSGTLVYSEIHSATTNDFGVVNLEIGQGSSKTGSISTIDWSVDSYFVKVEIDETGGTNYTLSGVSQLLSVPYALHANTFGGDMNNHSITNLASPVNTKDAVNKQYVDSILEILKLIQNGVNDSDGNHYNTKMIGDQIWMTENLRTTHYSNGDTIGTTYPFDKDISTDTVLKYQWAYNGDDANATIYGRLYTWYAVSDSRGVCPAGWHVPTDAEWTTLETYLGGSSIAGGKMKETGTTHWNTPNDNAYNSSGFTGLPGGNRLATGTYTNLGIIGMWWTSTGYNTANAWRRYLYYVNASVARQYLDKKNGFSVRCVRD